MSLEPRREVRARDTDMGKLFDPVFSLVVLFYFVFVLIETVEVEEITEGKSVKLGKKRRSQSKIVATELTGKVNKQEKVLFICFTIHSDLR